MMLSNLSYLSKTKGIGGRIKESPEDFMVEEILSDGTVLELDKTVENPDIEGDFTRFVLQKKEWTSEGAIRRIAKELRTGSKRFNYAGTKDKIAFTTQLVSAFGIEKKDILGLDLKDIKILGAWRHNEKVKLGGLLGNRFTIIVRNAENTGNVEKIQQELNGVFPNYFGEQRFGTTRKNTHLIGEHLLRGRTDLAVMEFVAGFEGETHEEAVAARKNLQETKDFGKALKDFPKHLKLERSVLAHLEKNPRDYANAFRKLPRGILLLFIHAYQSHLFNTLLSERIAEGEIRLEEGEFYCGETLGFPDLNKKSDSGFIAGKIIGSETKLNEREQRLLGELGIKPKDFNIKGIPEVSSKGTYRVLLSPLKDFSFNENTFRFSLQSGSYATVALREFLEEKK